MRDWLTSLRRNPHPTKRPIAHELLPDPAIGVLAQSLADLRHKLRRVAPSGDKAVAAIIGTLLRLEMRLVRPYRIAVTGEFNAGKSSIVNLLIGTSMMPTKAVSNTRVPTLIRYTPAPVLIAICSDGRRLALHEGMLPDIDVVTRLDVGLPVERLRVLEIADLPGMSDPLLQPQPLDVRRLGVDAAIWCTLATQAWKESERVAWLNLPDAVRRHGILIATNKDLLQGEEETKVLSRLRHLAGPFFEEIVMLATPQALSALDMQRTEAEAIRQASGGAALEEHVAAMLRNLAKRRIETIAGAAGRAAGRALQRLRDEDA
jgi:Dynamin family